MAERMKPTPMLKTIRQRIGNRSKKNFGVKGIPSMATNRKKIIRVSPKLIREDTFLDSRNRYLGTLTLVKMPALLIRDCMPCEVDSLK